MFEHLSTLLPALLPLIFFFSLLMGSFAYLLIRMRGTHSTLKQSTSFKHALLVTAGVAVITGAFCLTLACLVVFETFKILWN